MSARSPAPKVLASRLTVSVAEAGPTSHATVRRSALPDAPAGASEGRRDSASTREKRPVQVAPETGRRELNRSAVAIASPYARRAVLVRLNRTAVRNPTTGVGSGSVNAPGASPAGRSRCSSGRRWAESQRRMPREPRAHRHRRCRRSPIRSRSATSTGATARTSRSRCRSPGSVGVMLNNGDGTFAAMQQYTAGPECAGLAVDITLGDVTQPAGQPPAARRQARRLRRLHARTSCG